MFSYRDGLLRRRRRRLLYYLLLGLDQGEVCRKTSEDFDCSSRTIRRDLNVIGEWLPSLLHDESSEMMAYYTLYLDISDIEGMLFRIADSENVYVKLSSLRVLLTSFKKRFKLMKDIDFFKPIRLIQEIKEKNRYREDQLKTFELVKKEFEKEGKNSK